MSTPLTRVRALAHAELVLFWRNKVAIATALMVPLVLPLSVRSMADDLNLGKAGLSLGMILLPGAVGFSLLFAVYSTLVGVYVSRREELVLKRLRTGELQDREIITGCALPAIATGVLQSVLMAVGCTVLLDVRAPRAFPLAVLGLLLGVALSATLALLTAAVTRTSESAQVTTLPLVLVSVAGSGMAVPTHMLPDKLAGVCDLLPFSPVISLVRGGWTGDLTTHEVLAAVVTGLAWLVASVLAVRRWFRWEPRR